MSLPPSWAPLAGRNAVTAAAAAFLLIGVLGVHAYRSRAAVVGAGGAVVVVAAVELALTGNAAWGLGLSLAVLAMAGWLRVTGSRRLGGVAMLAGAALLGFGPGAPPGPWWVRAGVAVVTPAVSVGLASFDRRWGPVSLPLVAVAAAGIYGTSADTEQTLVLLAATVGVAAAGWWFSAGIGAVSAPALAGIMVWAAAMGGRGRHPEIIGAIGCLGLLVAEPVAVAAFSAVRSARPVCRGWVAVIGLGALQTGLVVAGHTAGLASSLRQAAAGVVATLALTVESLAVAGILWVRLAPRKTSQTGNRRVNPQRVAVRFRFGSGNP